MKERPILFSAPMVRAILAGTKTQTRRVAKLPIDDALDDGERIDLAWLNGDGHAGPGWYVAEAEYPEEGSHFVRCPYGVPGDRLWVRETWARGDAYCDPEAESVLYSADGQLVVLGVGGTPDRRLGAWIVHEDNRCSVRWRPSIHMPRWASRITLEVTGVRVERLQDISEEDARAEGFGFEPPSTVDPREGFRLAWSGLNGKRAPWASNPWVWAVEFKRAEAAARAA